MRHFFYCSFVFFSILLYYKIMNKNKFIVKEPIDMAEDLVYRWFSFIRYDLEFKPKKTAILFILLKILCLKLGLSVGLATQLTKTVVDKWVEECYHMSINDPDAQHHLVLMVESLIVEIKSANNSMKG